MIDDLTASGVEYSIRTQGGLDIVEESFSAKSGVRITYLSRASFYDDDSLDREIIKLAERYELKVANYNSGILRIESDQYSVNLEDDKSFEAMIEIVREPDTVLLLRDKLPINRMRKVIQAMYEEGGSIVVLDTGMTVDHTYRRLIDDYFWDDYVYYTEQALEPVSSEELKQIFGRTNERAYHYTQGIPFLLELYRQVEQETDETISGIIYNKVYGVMLASLWQGEGIMRDRDVNLLLALSLFDKINYSCLASLMSDLGYSDDNVLVDGSLVATNGIKLSTSIRIFQNWAKCIKWCDRGGGFTVVDPLRQILRNHVMSNRQDIIEIVG
jgi:hypothetical protein